MKRDDATLSERLAAAAHELHNGRVMSLDDADLLAEAACAIQRLQLAHADLQAAIAIADERYDRYRQWQGIVPDA